jgi:hypothetical protein
MQGVCDLLSVCRSAPSFPSSSRTTPSTDAPSRRSLPHASHRLFAAHGRTPDSPPRGKLPGTNSRSTPSRRACLALVKRFRFDGAQHLLAGARNVSATNLCVAVTSVYNAQHDAGRQPEEPIRAGLAEMPRSCIQSGRTLRRDGHTCGIASLARTTARKRHPGRRPRLPSCGSRKPCIGHRATGGRDCACYYPASSVRTAVHDRAHPAARPLLTAISFLTSVPNSTAAASIVVGVARHDQAEPPCPGCRSIDVPGVPPHRRRVLAVVVGGIHDQYYRPASRDLAMWQITGTLAECTRRRWGTQQALALPTTTRTRTNNSYHSVRAKMASTATSVLSQWPARASTIAHSTSATSPTTINVTLKRAIYAAPHSRRRPRHNMAIS